MEEDIEILEELTSQKYSERLLNTLSMVKEEDEVYILTIHERQAIENLLTRYKQLELENQALKNNQANCPAINTSGFKCKLKQNRDHRWQMNLLEED